MDYSMVYLIAAFTLGGIMGVIAMALLFMARDEETDEHEEVHK